MSRALVAVTHLLGVAAFVYPFFLGSIDPSPAGAARAGDAPALFTLLGGLLIAIAFADVRAGRMDAKHVALLGVLSGLNAVLRLPGAFGGASLMFFLPIVCGYAFGARFGFLLGAASMSASAAITGGAGPWLPFQMWALGWVGGGGALLRRLGDGRAAVLGLAAYGWVAGFAFGALTNLWFWPFQAGASDIAWVPGTAALDALRRYWRFYVLTSLSWDAARAIMNAVLILVLARPVLRLLLRFRARLFVSWDATGKREGIERATMAS